jgi:type IV secretory pathway VirB10-like protein
MAFSTTSFFAGVGTVFAAITIGFAGGALITTSPRMEPNRLERVAANTPSTFAAASKAEKPQVPAVPSVNADAPAVPPVLATNATPEPAASPDRITTAASASPQVIPPPPQLVVANVSSELDNAKKLREAELRKQEFKESERRAEQRRERRKRQEIEAAATAVKRIQRDGVLQEASQREETPSLGFFGETPKLGSFGHD